MVSVCFYFQVHQPYRIRRDFSYFSIGSHEPFEDDEQNAAIMRKVAKNCYLPTNQLMLDLIERHQGKFRISYAITGTALEQFEEYAPEVLESFQQLAKTGQVEFIAETYYHSLAFLFSEKDFIQQVQKHQTKIHSLFGVNPRSFRNTELIYNNNLAQITEELGFSTILTEGADRILDWRSPNFLYQPKGCQSLKLLLKNYRLSDDIAFRFSDQNWNHWPLHAETYAQWLHQIAGSGDLINLFMDYETFGEHQWDGSGIFHFLEYLPTAILRHPDFSFATPQELSSRHRPVASLDIPQLVSWADTERDTSAWLGNSLQDAAAERVFGLEQKVMATKDEALIHAWRKLQTSDHFYYMCTKYFQDGDVHKYFNPYDSPYEAFICYCNAINQLEWTIEQREVKRLDQVAKRVHESLYAGDGFPSLPLNARVPGRRQAGETSL
ncbi:MAG: glycoside hydrolase family 57 protein [Oligoflexus sp.]